MSSRGCIILVNPNSLGESHPAVRGFLHTLSVTRPDVEIYLTRSAAELHDQARRAVDDASSCVVACGGDGTVNAVLQSLVGTSTALGILPAGRGNDIARNLSIPRDPRRAWEIVDAGYSRRLDVGRVGERYFLGVAGAGLDSRVNRYADSHRRRFLGRMAYPLALLQALPGFRPPTMSLRLPRTTFRGGMMFLAVGNLPAYGGGMRIAPTALPNDGLLDVCLVKACARLRLLAEFPRVYLGRHLLAGLTEYWRTEWLEIESDPSVEVRADGEYVAHAPVRLEIVPNILNVLVSPETI